MPANQSQPWLRAELIAPPEATFGAQLMIPADGLEFHDDQLVFHHRGEVVYVAEHGQLRSLTWSARKPDPELERQRAQWPKRGTRWTDEEREDLRRQLLDGTAWDAISSAHGRSRTGVQQEAVKQGWVYPDTMRVTPAVAVSDPESAAASTETAPTLDPAAQDTDRESPGEGAGASPASEVPGASTPSSSTGADDPSQTSTIRPAANSAQAAITSDHEATPTAESGAATGLNGHAAPATTAESGNQPSTSPAPTPPASTSPASISSPSISPGSISPASTSPASTSAVSNLPGSISPASPTPADSTPKTADAPITPDRQGVADPDNSVTTTVPPAADRRDLADPDRSPTPPPPLPPFPPSRRPRSEAPDIPKQRTDSSPGLLARSLARTTLSGYRSSARTASEAPPPDPH